MSNKLKEERLINTLVGPHVSEKGAMAEAVNQVVFKVRVDSTKADIREAVEMMFDVKVENVRVVNVRGKVKRFGRTVGRRNNWKKAYVTLAEGSDIELLGAAE